jgi:GNAT superfamily N-acetyltransferase
VLPFPAEILSCTRPSLSSPALAVPADDNRRRQASRSTIGVMDTTTRREGKAISVPSVTVVSDTCLQRPGAHQQSGPGKQVRKRYRGPEVVPHSSPTVMLLAMPHLAPAPEPDTLPEPILGPPMNEPHPAILFATPRARAVELGRDDAPELQRFFDANPDYFIAVTGAPAGVREALDEINGRPPAGWSWTRQWVVGFLDDDDALLAMANVVSDLPAGGVWHIGLFIVATPSFGVGLGRELHEAIVAWARGSGARWMRLGVVVGNERAERFWLRQGYVETRLRHGVVMGERVNSVRVMIKPLDGAPLCDYLALVERDRPPA